LEKSPPVPPVQEECEKPSERVQYLIDHVLIPLFNGEKVHSADLDFKQFDWLDINELYDYYMNHYYHGESDWQKLRKVYKLCKNAESLTKAVSFI
jgi:hypothetical protein